MADTDIKYSLTLDADQFKVVVNEVGRGLREMQATLQKTADTSKSVDNHFNSLGSSFRRFIITLGAARFALMDINDIFLTLPGNILKTTGEFERLQKLMEGLSTAGEDTAKKLEAAGNVKFLQSMSQNAPFALKSLSDAFVKLKSGGIDPTDGSMKALVDSVAKFGGTSDTMHRASIAIQQMSGKGVISMEELRQQLGEAIPTAMKTMAQSMGMTMQQLTDHIKKGEVTAAPALERMLLMMGIMNRNAANDMMDTWTGMVQRLQSKLQLLGNDIGGGGFGEAMKVQLSKVLALFDDPKFREVGFRLGDTLVKAVEQLGSAAEFVVQNWDRVVAVMKTVASIWAVKEVTNWIASVVVASQTFLRAKQSEYQKSVEAQTAVLRVSAMERAARAEDLANAEATSRAKMALKDQEWAATMRQIEIEKAARAAQIAALQKIYTENAAMVRGSVGGSMLSGGGAALTAERIAATNALHAETAAMEANILALQKKAAAQAIEVAETRTSVLAHQAAAKEMMLMNTALDTGITRMGLMARSATALGVAFNALGGWLGLITLAIQAGILAWIHYGDAAEEAMARERRAKRNTSTEEDRVAAQKELDEKKKTVDDLQKTVDARVAAGDGLETALPQKQKNLWKLIAALENAKKLYFDELQKFNVISAQVNERVVSELSRGVVGMAENAANQAERNVTVSFVERIKKQTEDMKGLKDKALANAEKVLNDLKVEEAKARSSARAKSLTDSRDAVSAELANLVATNQGNSERAKTLIDAQKRLNELVASAASESARANAILGTAVIAPKPTNDKPEHPLTRALEAMKGDVASAELKLQDVTNRTAGLAAREREVALKIMGDLASGRFDYSLPKTADGNIPRHFMGGIEERKTYVEQLARAYASGTKTTEEYVASLGKLTEAEKQDLVQLIKGQAKRAETEEGINAMSQAVQRLAGVHEELDAAMVRMNSNGLAKTDTGLKNLLKQYDKLTERKLGPTKELAAFQETMGKSIAAQVTVSGANYVTDERIKSRQVAQQWIDAYGTVGAARKMQYDSEMAQINAENQQQVENLKRGISAAPLGSQERIAAERMLIEVERAGDIARNDALTKYGINSRTELEKMRRDWLDTTEQMNRATASWAQNVVDSILSFVDTGKFEWSKMIKTMMQQTFKIQLQEQIALPLTTAMKGLGDWVTKTLGIGQTAAKVAAEGSAAAGLSAVSGSAGMVVAGFTTLVAAVTNLYTAFTIAAAEIQMAGAGATAGGVGGVFGSGMSSIWELFADGGVMTEFGSVPLRKYAAGGIATNPQLAMYGEGSTPEAYVPLPDGRSIPVTMAGGAQANVQVNVINQTGTPVSARQSGSPYFDGRQMILDVVLSAANSPGSFRDGMKGAMSQ